MRLPFNRPDKKHQSPDRRSLPLTRMDHPRSCRKIQSTSRTTAHHVDNFDNYIHYQIASFRWRQNDKFSVLRFSPIVCAFSVLLGGILANSAQVLAAAPQAERDAILAQQGCYLVTFNYRETEAHDPNFPLRPPKSTSVMEWVSVDESSADHIVLQHVLVTPPRIKHWKQIWDYEKTTFDVYSGPNEWTQITIEEEEAKGRWVQSVRGVADNPRYACAGSWTLGREPSWECQTWAPKPRRDRRRAYDVLERTNGHIITDYGWLHEQANRKLRLSGSKATPVASEVGKNTYLRIDDEDCAKAADWWTERKATWALIQEAWNEVTAEHKTFRVAPSRNRAPLWIRLFWLARRAVPEAKYDRLRTRAREHILRDLQPAEAVGSPPRSVGPPQQEP